MNGFIQTRVTDAAEAVHRCIIAVDEIDIVTDVGDYTSIHTSSQVDGEYRSIESFDIIVAKIQEAYEDE